LVRILVASAAVFPLESAGLDFSCNSTVQRNQLGAAGEALMQHEKFEANRLPLVLAVGVSIVKKALKCTFLMAEHKVNYEGVLISP
jgi:hypothetical protein